MEALSKKKKKNQSNMLVVGYAALAKSGKQIALSQPFAPNLGEEKQKALKLLWAKPKGKIEAPTSSKTKRRLHFSLKLEQESDRGTHADDDSFSAQTSYNPEVVKIVVGLKCGDETFPLGIANLVVNGKEASEQNIDMALRPINETSYADSKQKSRLGIFGSGKKQQGSSFSNHDQLYMLASNATLRVRVDVKEGISGECKTAVWGDGDDASYATNSSYDTRTSLASLARSLITQGTQQQMTTTSSVGSGFPSQRHFEEEEIPRPSNGVDRRSMEKSVKSVWAEVTQDNDPRIITSQTPKQPIRGNIPVEFVVVRSPSDGRSLASGLTSPAPGFFSSLFFRSCCGDENESTYGQQGRIANSFSFEDDEPSWDDEDDDDSLEPPEMVSSRSEDDTSGTDEDQTSAASEEICNVEKESVNGSTARKGEALRLAVAATKSSLDDCEADDGESAGAETVDITVATLTDLKDAQATLLRYATKTGVKMEDLLAGRGKSKKGKFQKSASESFASLSVQ
jgi:hypothetical protein